MQYISGNPYVVKDSQIDRFEQIKKEYESPGATSTETKQALKSEFSPYVPPESTPEYRPTRENTQNTTIIFQDNQVVAEVPTSYASKFEDAIKTAPQSSFSDGKAVIYAAMASGAILDNGFKMSSPEENDRLSVTRDAFRDVCARQAEALYGITNGEEFVANQIYKKSHEDGRDDDAVHIEKMRGTTSGESKLADSIDKRLDRDARDDLEVHYETVLGKENGYDAYTEVAKKSAEKLCCKTYF